MQRANPERAEDTPPCPRCEALEDALRVALDGIDLAADLEPRERVPALVDLLMRLEDRYEAALRLRAAA